MGFFLYILFWLLLLHHLIFTPEHRMKDFTHNTAKHKISMIQPLLLHNHSILITLTTRSIQAEWRKNKKRKEKIMFTFNPLLTSSKQQQQ